MAGPFANSNRAYDAVFRKACRGGDTSHLEYLIIQGRFDVHKSLYDFMDQPPLVSAVVKRSMVVASLLITYGADVNAQNCLPLRRAMDVNQLDMMHLLITRGADPGINDPRPVEAAIQKNKPEAVRLLFKHGAVPTHDIMHVAILLADSDASRLETLTIVLDQAILVGEQVGADEQKVLHGKYAKVYRAILDGDFPRITELLGHGDYGTYENLFRDEDRLNRIGARYAGVEMVKIFVRAGVALDDIYWEAVIANDLELLYLLREKGGFDMNMIDPELEITVLHFAFFLGILETMKVLVEVYGIDINIPDLTGSSPIFRICNDIVLKDVLGYFFDINLNHLNMKGENVLNSYKLRCRMYRTALQYGADPRPPAVRCDPIAVSHECCNEFTCAVVEYFQKMLLVDRNYVETMLPYSLEININEFQTGANVDEFRTEIAQLQGCQISRSTSTTSSKSLFDFIVMGANEVVRYANNQEILEIYEKNQCDFNSIFPNYGFALNYQLRKGEIRRQRVEAALQWLESVIETGLPEEFGFLIFGHFNNAGLKRFSTEWTDLS